jgi:serine/threonine protein kinase
LGRSGQFPGALQEGDLVGDACTVVDYIGRGAMGHVYRVRHNVLNAEYALKMLSLEQAGEEASRLFQREAGAIKILSHPNLVRIYDVGLHGGRQPYYAMELLVGRDLARAIRDSGPLPPVQAAAIFSEVCAGLEYVHKKGIVHRDIKPSNIFLLEKAGSSGERVKVVDFGIVSFTQAKRSDDKSEDIHGTPFYMSPEQCMGEIVDARSDIYSLGCTMYEALTGNLPFSGKSPTETMEMQVRTPAPTLSEKGGGREYPAAWETIIAKSMAKDPADRFQSMAEISDKLAEVMRADQSARALASGHLDPAQNKNCQPGIFKRRDTSNWYDCLHRPWRLALFFTRSAKTTSRQATRKKRPDHCRQCTSEPSPTRTGRSTAGNARWPSLLAQHQTFRLRCHRRR